MPLLVRPWIEHDHPQDAAAICEEALAEADGVTLRGAFANALWAAGREGRGSGGDVRGGGP